MSDTSRLQKFSFASGQNLAFIDALYEKYRQDENSVDESWRQFFQGFEFALKSEGQGAGSHGGDQGEAKVEAFINAYRRLGHLSADLNPLWPKPDVRSDMSPAAHGLGGVSPDEEFSPSNLPVKLPIKFAKIQSLITDTYSGKIGADFRDSDQIEQVVWLQQQMESCRNKPAVAPKAKLLMLNKLMRAEGFERFLQDRYLGQKRFSIEGVDSMLISLDVIADEAAGEGVGEINLGMAHRGRLNVLTNFMGKPYELMLKEFEGSDSYSFDIDGDVKYHMGYANSVKTYNGRDIRLYLTANPSHLEVVNPVLEGFARARQRLLGDNNRDHVLPILIHGDAAFIGQGTVAETLNFAYLDAYTTGGTIHVIANNQVGFTTNPEEARSCTYASDIAKVIRAPIFHVNADDPEAVAWVSKLAFAFRKKFHRDVVIDLIGYRRHGHNETDEPMFTQPIMYRIIKEHETVWRRYAKQLAAEGVISLETAEANMKEFRNVMQTAQDNVRAKKYNAEIKYPKEYDSVLKYVPASAEDVFATVKTGVDAKILQQCVQNMTEIPKTFNALNKVAKLYESRREMMKGDGNIDWGLAEVLAYATLSAEGRYVRLSGQDCRRGTFSHRQAVITDSENGSIFESLKQGPLAKGAVDIINSPLSEQGCMGFEFGYSVADKEALILWEAQYGDFVNGAQIIIDQFLVACESKWKHTSGLVLLLPHGYEGGGPEHSSARPERFLQLCGNLNIQVANLTTPAQIFHILRRQLHRPFRKPLVIMSPKVLLRHPKAKSTINDLAKGTFQEILDDPSVENPSKVERLLLVTGKLYYELDAMREEKLKGKQNIAIVRLEQLYPFHEAKFEEVVKRYNKVKEIFWVQEEPRNMGSWSFIRDRVSKFVPEKVSFDYIGRKSAGTTAEGSAKAHAVEQARIVETALGLKDESKDKPKRA